MPPVEDKTTPHVRNNWIILGSDLEQKQSNLQALLVKQQNQAKQDLVP